MTLLWPWALLLLPLPLLGLARHLPSWPSVRSRSGHRGALADGGERDGGGSDASLAANGAVRLPPALGEALDALERGARRRGDARHALLWLAWLGLVVALARPSLPGDAVVQPISGRALALVVDLSGSMEREDFTLDGVADDRLAVVKRVAGDFLERRAGDRVALVLFGREAFVAAAPTFDLAALRATLDGAGIAMAGRSTAIGDALGLALQTLRDDPAAEKAIVLLSDGTNNAGSVEPESAAELAAALDVRVHTIALGSDAPTRGGLRTAVSADLDEATLEAISARSGGRFFRARTSAELGRVYAEIDRLERAAAPAPPLIPTRELGHLPLALALLALLGTALVERYRS